MPDDPTLTALLFEKEGTSLDFKREQYGLAGASDPEKAELLKDILAFVNAWRRSDAFILIGVEERPGSKAEVVGIMNHLKDADLQQFVNSKTNAPVEVSYAPAELEGKSVGVIRIPVQDRPRFLLKPFGGLPPDLVFIRRGSSTAAAKPDEIAKMGAAAAAPVPRLRVTFADVENRQLKSDFVEITALYLDIGNIEQLPDYSESPPDVGGIPFPYTGTVNRDYYRQLAWYTVTRKLCTSLQIAVTNASESLAHDVRVELTVSAPHVLLLDDDSWPELPERRSDSLVAISRMRFKKKNGEDSVTSRRLDDRWVVEIRVTKVQPKGTAWVPGFLYVGQAGSGEIVLNGTVSADNLPTPQQAKLTVLCSAERRDATLKDVLDIERVRFLASPEGRRIQEESEHRRREKGGG